MPQEEKKNQNSNLVNLTTFAFQKFVNCVPKMKKYIFNFKVYSTTIKYFNYCKICFCFKQNCYPFSMKL